MSYLFKVGLILGMITCLGWARDNVKKPWSWEKPQAKVDPRGDLQWAPLPYTPPKKLGVVRYIDFADGDDDNDGMSPQTAWKHHPWDPAAGGKARQAGSVNTFVFKRGVIYRGRIVLKHGGSAEQPLRLISLPSWGTGEAVISAAEEDRSWRRVPNHSRLHNAQ
ncbi:MAG: hypothetical protein D6820_15180, partial [Lentisphaerae bacterium]